MMMVMCVCRGVTSYTDGLCESTTVSIWPKIKTKPNERLATRGVERKKTKALNVIKKKQNKENREKENLNRGDRNGVSQTKPRL